MTSRVDILEVIGLPCD